VGTVAVKFKLTSGTFMGKYPIVVTTANGTVSSSTTFTVGP
jgi:hypothetical protein